MVSRMDDAQRSAKRAVRRGGREQQACSSQRTRESSYPCQVPYPTAGQASRGTGPAHNWPQSSRRPLASWVATAGLVVERGKLPRPPCSLLPGLLFLVALAMRRATSATGRLRPSAASARNMSTHVRAAAEQWRLIARMPNWYQRLTRLRTRRAAMPCAHASVAAGSLLLSVCRLDNAAQAGSASVVRGGSTSQASRARARAVIPPWRG